MLVLKWFEKCRFLYTERNYLFKKRSSALIYYGKSIFLKIFCIILKVIFFLPFILFELIQYLILWLAAWPLIGLPAYLIRFVLNLFSFMFFWIMMLPNIYNSYYRHVPYRIYKRALKDDIDYDGGLK